jgi:hypothetical protein
MRIPFFTVAGRSSRKCVFQVLFWLTCTPNSEANSFAVLCPFTASHATLALNSFVYRFLFITYPFLSQRVYLKTLSQCRGPL